MILSKIVTFIKALFFHISVGMPKSSQYEIQERYNICSSCPHLNSIKQECEICGCSINNRSQFFNKLAWADQECPIGKWRKICK